MRDARDLKNTKVKVGGKSGKVVGFWVTENNVVYAKIKDYTGATTNHRLTELNSEILLINEKESEE
jgi:hypothetical protein